MVTVTKGFDVWLAYRLFLVFDVSGTLALDVVFSWV